MDADLSNSEHAPDIISTVATIAAPIYVVFRLYTGGWAFLRFFALVCLVIAPFYLYLLRSEPEHDCPDVDSADAPKSE